MKIALLIIGMLALIIVLGFIGAVVILAQEANKRWQRYELDGRTYWHAKDIEP
jgi:hypothetical protein